jgi:hypothetical protein
MEGGPGFRGGSAQRLANARESGMRMINPTTVTTITMTTTFGSLKLWLATTSAAAMLRWLVPSAMTRLRVVKLPRVHVRELAKKNPAKAGPSRTHVCLRGVGASTCLPTSRRQSQPTPPSRPCASGPAGAAGEAGRRRLSRVSLSRDKAPQRACALP